MTETITLVGIPVIQITPLVPVADLHAEITVFLEIFLVTVAAVIFSFNAHILILRTGWGIIYIVRGLPSFVCGGATAQCSYNECQE